MTPLHDTSNIPDDPSYWSSLTDRVSRHALMRRQGLLLRMSTMRGICVAAACLILVVTLGWMRERNSDRLDGAGLGVPESAPSLSSALFGGER